MSTKRHKVKLSSGFSLYLSTTKSHWVAELVFTHQCTIRTWYLNKAITFEAARSEAIACYNRWLDDIHIDTSKRNCAACGNFCNDPVEGELHKPYCSVDCLRQNGDCEPIG